METISEMSGVTVIYSLAKAFWLGRAR